MPPSGRIHLFPMTDNPQSSNYALPHIGGLEAYVPGEQPGNNEWIKLNTNENPYPPSPVVGEAIQRESETVRLYPNPKSAPLREAIADKFGLQAAQVIVGNGSDDILNLLTRCFCGRGRAAGTTRPSYSLYPALCGIQDGDLIQIPFARDMELPVDEIAASGANIFFLTSPNTPTGVGFSTERIAEALESFSGLLVVDEAYADFANVNAVPLLARYSNLVITRSFSKSYGLAGMRVGYGLASEEVIDLLDRVRDSYNVNSLSQAAALAALGDWQYYRGVIFQIVETRDNYIGELREMDWFTYPSQANFLFTEPRDGNGRSGAEIARGLVEFLKERKILVRYFGGDTLTDSFVRISIGTEEQMKTFMETIESWQKSSA